MLKFQDNPPIIYPPDVTVREIPGLWWIAHTKARFEKAFAWDLLAQEIPFFLPLIPRTILSGGRKRHGMAALFPSYVFFSGDQTIRYAAMRTNRLCQVIEVHDQPRLIAELSNIELALCGNAPLDPYPFAAVGQLCRIAKGPFQGLLGTVVSRDKTARPTARFVLQVSVLGQGVSLEIDADFLETA